MEKVTKTYNELNELQRLKVAKVLKYRNLFDKLNECKIVLEGESLRYIFVGDEMIDVNY